MDERNARQHIERLISMGEDLRTEFKKAEANLPRNLFETVCAMLNRDGGDILLGVDDNGRVSGIGSRHLERMKSDIVSLSNNPEKLDPPFILYPVEHTLKGKTIMHLSIPASSQTHRSAGVVFDRSEDGDFRVTEPHRIAEISNRKRATYTENKIYSAVTADDLRLDMLPKLRVLMLARDPNHPWSSLSDKVLMTKAGLYRKDTDTGEQGYTLAAVLLLGKDEIIHSTIPHYRIDALLRRVQVDRYDDRDRIECNLIDAYGRLMDFIAKHLPDPFHLEGDVRISLRDKVFREVVANFLVHREYMNAHPARLTIYKDHVETENASNYRIQGVLDPENIIPFSKNPTIAKFFSQLGWAEELGSGMVNIGKYLPLYSPGKKPEYRDGAVFTTVIPLSEDVAGLGKSREKGREKLVEKDFRVNFKENFRVNFRVTGKQLERMIDMVMKLYAGNILIVEEISREYGVSERTIHEDLRRLKQWGLVRFEGAPKTGQYILTGKGRKLLEAKG